MENIEKEAQNLGWVPLDQFRGDPEKWVDAETFVKRGQEIMPILRKNNEVLQNTVGQLQAKVDHLTELVAAGQESMAALKELHASDVKRKVEQAKKELLASLKQAKTEGDIDAELALQDQLSEVNAQLKIIQEGEQTGKPVKASQPAVPSIDPITKRWVEENPWFEKDKALTGLAMGLAQALREDPTTSNLTGAAFYNKLDERLAEYLPNRRNTPSKVAETRGSGGASGGEGGRSYNDLPPEAKAECEKDSAKFVGEGRAFKTKAEWQAHFASLYFGE